MCPLEREDRQALQAPRALLRRGGRRKRRKSVHGAAPRVQSSSVLLLLRFSVIFLFSFILDCAVANLGKGPVLIISRFLGSLTLRQNHSPDELACLAHPISE